LIIKYSISGNTFKEKWMSYYEPQDLKHFSDVGDFRKDLADKFFDYYGASTSADGALTVREKALIGLAVSFARECPYCIDAFTTKCLEAGANPEQMTEAIHVATAVGGAAILVLGVQMNNSMKRSGV
jgi:alkylhydroperoxidase/carboxymuconolactone decarboxylase family protein